MSFSPAAGREESEEGVSVSARQCVPGENVNHSSARPVRPLRGFPYVGL